MKKEEDSKTLNEYMSNWVTQREKNLFKLYIRPTLTPLNGNKEN